MELSAFIRHAINSVRPAFDRQGQELVISLPDQAVWFDADPVRLTQVVENLLSNASKYTDRGGRIEVNAMQDGEELKITIQDNGIGIEANLLPHVFELFIQADRSLDRSQGGLGIGLTLVRTLVEMHGGTVEAHSQGIGKGSEFIVRLPIMLQPQAMATPRSNVIRVSPRRILIVEDHVGTATVLSRLLAKTGKHEIQMAHDGIAAMEMAKTFRPELVLLDIGLPVMNGYEVAIRLREIPDGDKLFIVALSGYGQEKDRHRSKAAGFDEHLLKPPALEVLQSLFNHPKLDRQKTDSAE